MERETVTIELQRFRTAQLAELYGENERTFRRMLEKFKYKLGPKDGYKWSIEQVIMIIEHLDYPNVKIKSY